MTPLGIIPHSTSASIPQLYAARHWLEREGRQAEHIAVTAFIDKYRPPTVVRGATVQGAACGRSALAV